MYVDKTPDEEEETKQCMCTKRFFFENSRVKCLVSQNYQFPSTSTIEKSADLLFFNG